LPIILRPAARHCDTWRRSGGSGNRHCAGDLPAILLTRNAGDVTTPDSRSVEASVYTLMRKPATAALWSARVNTLLERV